MSPDTTFPRAAAGRSGWRARLAAILRAHYERAARKDKAVGDLTRKKRWEVLFTCFRELRAMGYMIENPANLGERHVQALVARWDGAGQSAATIQNKLSLLRIFARWIGKPGLVRASAAYASTPGRLRRAYAARVDKSWSAHGVDFDALVTRVSTYDRYVGVQLKLAEAFGLRRQEAVLIKPLRSWQGEYLRVIAGTKGGRERLVHVVSDQQRAVLEEACALAHANRGFISERRLTKTQALRRFTYVLDRCGVTRAELGVTAHGLRHEFANRRLESLGIVSPVRGGAKGQLPREEEAAAKLTVSEELGHSRLDVTAAYYGTHRRLPGRGTLIRAAKARAAVLAGQESLSEAELRELQALARELLDAG